MLDILRSSTEKRDIKVIMMTSLCSVDQRARGEQLGADRYLVKSQVGIEDVVRTVHEVLGDAPVTQQTPQQIFNRPSPQPTTRQAEPYVPERPTEQTVSQPQQQPMPQPAPAPAAEPQDTTPQPAVPAPAPQQEVPATPTAPNPTPDFSLPQPTAPFSSPRPANLGERIIHPIETPANTMPDVASLMNQELDSATQADTPSPVAPPAPSMPQQAPYTPPQIPQEDHPGISFEETNRPAPSAPQNTPPSYPPQQ